MEAHWPNWARRTSRSSYGGAIGAAFYNKLKQQGTAPFAPYLGRLLTLLPFRQATWATARASLRPVLLAVEEQVRLAVLTRGSVVELLSQLDSLRCYGSSSFPCICHTSRCAQLPYSACFVCLSVALHSCT